MTFGCKTPDDVMKLIKDEGVEMVDLRLTDVPGGWQHISYPVAHFGEDAVAEGKGFDGSSVSSGLLAGTGACCGPATDPSPGFPLSVDSTGTLGCSADGSAGAGFAASSDGGRSGFGGGSSAASDSATMANVASISAPGPPA